MLMDLRTLDWHEPSLELMGIPASLLPAIRPSGELYGEATVTALRGRPVCALVGDQQAALYGQTCFARGEAKNTYGTGSFLLVNTGHEIVASERLLTSVAAKIGAASASYVL
jgi:glycerol kinase